MASGPAGFHTGFKIAGEIAGLIDMELRGRVSINGPDSDQAFQLAGHSHLWILNHRIFQGDIRIADKEFLFEGDLDLFPRGSPLRVQGRLSGLFSEERFLLAGRVETVLFGLALLGAEIYLGSDRVYLKGTLLGVSAELEIRKRGEELAILGQISLDLWGVRALTGVDIGGQGVTLLAEMDPVDIGVFKLHGEGQPKPSALLKVSDNQIKEARFSAVVELLGITSTTQVLLAESGISFNTSGKIFGVTDCSLYVSGRDFSGEGLLVRATVQDSLINKIKRGTLEIITTAVDKANGDLTTAINSVEAAQQNVRRLDTVIAEQRQIVASEREQAHRKLQAAQRAVASAQAEVDGIRRTIQQKEAQIARLKRGRYINILFIKVWVYDDPLALVKMAAIRVEITALWVAYGVATAALATANAALKIAEGVVKLTPVDIDPRVAGPLVAREAAVGALELAKDFLKTARAGVNAFGDISTFLLAGTEELLQIHSATFKLTLNQAQGGNITMIFDLTIMERRDKIALPFSLRDPLASVKSIGGLLLRKPA